MKFIYQDLLRFLKEQPSKAALSEKLFQLGHEHDIDGEIFDMEITPNRGDCLSLFGLSRDLNYFYNSIDPFEIYNEDLDLLDLNFKNLSITSCPKITFLEIEIDEKISSYKPYLENYFSQLGNKKTNFFSDISNYISYERGQPTHCFDKKSITKDLTFTNKLCDEKFKTLLGKEIQLEGENCVFTSSGEVVSLAGIMGGESTSCSENTREVLVECAFFNPEAIIGKSVKYNLKSDAAHKFERGVDIEAQEKVLRRFISVVKDHAVIKKLSMKTFISGNFNKKCLPIKIDKINRILGTKLSKEQYISFLNKLGFEIDDEIKVPSFRNDVASQNDLSEEVARIIGYDDIKSIPLSLKSRSQLKLDKISKIKDFLIENSFNEVINMPFTDIEEKKSIFIDNPLDSNRRNLRTSLKSSLVENLLFNERRQKDSIKLFEISDVYSNEKKIIQEQKLGIIVSGKSGHNHKDFSKKLDRRYLNEILNLDKNKSVFEIEEIPRENLRTKKKDKIFYTEVLLEDIPEAFLVDHKAKKSSINFIKYVPVSDFPSSVRDFSFSIKDFDTYNTVISCIENFEEENLKDFFIFDFYLNEKLKEIKVGIRLIFQSSTRTLSEEDIQMSIGKILKPIIDLDGVIVPGLELN
tara:strand:- start:854 stop:2761 length:1908 start_codon:yes stop_codon:yes gene_type:complete